MDYPEDSVLWLEKAAGAAKGSGSCFYVTAKSGALKTVCEYHKTFIPYDGDLRWSVRNLDHNGWLLCDGRSLSKTTYPKLFDVVGYSFGGSGDTFYLPNPKDKVVGVTGSSHTAGYSTGSETHTLSVDEIPSHTHTGTTDSSGSAYESETVMGGVGATVAGSDSHTHTFTTNSTGGSQAHNIMQPTLFVGNLFVFTSDLMEPDEDDEEPEGI
jgi:microcystin-dependent protein